MSSTGTLVVGTEGISTARSVQESKGQGPYQGCIRPAVGATRPNLLVSSGEMVAIRTVLVPTAKAVPWSTNESSTSSTQRRLTSAAVGTIRHIQKGRQPLGENGGESIQRKERTMYINGGPSYKEPTTNPMMYRRSTSAIGVSAKYVTSL